MHIQEKKKSRKENTSNYTNTFLTKSILTSIIILFLKTGHMVLAVVYNFLPLLPILYFSTLGCSWLFS